VVALSVEPPGHASVYQVIRSERVVFEKAALQAFEESLRRAGPKPARGRS